ncbi:MAG: M3 family oligoendopeptidase [Anaerolineae bacterium]|jgi:oligoendopeptidase F|nr:M3 family oligoendopeptidase [Anaerolineae bacterium]
MLAFEWQDLLPYYQALHKVQLHEGNIEEWLEGWSNLDKVVVEINNRRYIATTRDTTDKHAKAALVKFLDTIMVNVKDNDQRLTEKLLSSGVNPEGFQMGLLTLRTKAALYTKRNLNLLNEQYVTATQYDEIAGSQTIEWNGEVKTVTELQPLLYSVNREERETVWRASAERQLKDREKINKLWQRLFEMRNRIAVNAGLKYYREYRWLELYRYAYSPAECVLFHDSIRKVIVPAVSKLMKEHAQRLGVEKLRPWDLQVESLIDRPLYPYQQPHELEEKATHVFRQIHPDFGRSYRHMREYDLLDLHNRNNKAPGGFTLELPISGEPFSLLNCVGLHSDLMGTLHEGGHCMHFYDILNGGKVKFYQEFESPVEFAEVAAMAMELLALPHLESSDGSSFYSPEDHRIAELQAFRSILTFIPYMSVVDLFQHWAYANPHLAVDPEQCNATWSHFWDVYMPDADWTGFEDVKATGWQRKIHIFSDPFYYVEYGLAQMGALQVWQNAQQDQTAAVEALRNAFKLGGSVGLRELFETAKVNFIFEEKPMQELINAVMARVEELTQAL